MFTKDIAKTASVHKYFLVVLAILVAVGIALALLTGFHQTRVTLHTPANKKYTLLVARTGKAQEKGLGDRASLPKDEGMLFVFSGQAVRCFWMKDMHFSLDMVWFNSQKRVVALRQDVSPATYPDSFCPSQLAKYVIELNAGQAQMAGIHIGETLKF